MGATRRVVDIEMKGERGSSIRGSPIDHAEYGTAHIYGGF